MGVHAFFSGFCEFPSSPLSCRYVISLRLQAFLLLLCDIAREPAVPQHILTIPPIPPGPQKRTRRIHLQHARQVLHHLLHLPRNANIAIAVPGWLTNIQRRALLDAGVPPLSPASNIVTGSVLFALVLIAIPRLFHRDPGPFDHQSSSHDSLSLLCFSLFDCLRAYDLP